MEICFLFIIISSGLSLNLVSNVQSSSRQYIPGPMRLTDKIAIVGAGPSGLHMAYLLKKKGFKNITIFERSTRVGGKSYSVNYNGNPQEMGATYLGDVKNTREFLTDIGINFGPRTHPETFLENGKPPVLSGEFDIYKAMQYLKTDNATLAVIALQQAIMRFTKLHQELFDFYEGFMILRPSKDVLWRTRGTFKQFLERHNMSLLEDTFIAQYTPYGYGHIDEIPALYWLFLYNAALKLHIIPSGMQSVWKTVVSHSKLHVVYNAEVVKMRRSLQNGRRVFLLTYREHFERGMPRYRHETADFVVWTPEMRTSLNAMGATERERELFDRTTTYYITSFLVDSTRLSKSLTPAEWYFDDIKQGYHGNIGGLYDSFAGQNRYNQTICGTLNSANGEQMCTKRFSTVHQYTKTRPSAAMLNRTSKSYGERLQKLGKVIESKIWRYFPHYSCQDMDRGIIWDILDLQGQEGIWYLGSSIYFEAINPIIDYNKFLVESMIPTHDDNGSKCWSSIMS